jgi:AcrR family transcriptional regulator
VGYRHSRDEILEAAIAVSLEDGMAGLTFKSVGARLGISDRTVVYYFPTKPDLVTAVALALVAGLEQILEQAFGSEPQTQEELIDRAWPVVAMPEADRVFSLYFEIVGLAASGQAPYDAIARSLVAGWVDWLVPRMRGSSPEVRRRRALATVAQIDGLLLVRQVLGSDAGDAAARESGVRARRADVSRDM